MVMLQGSETERVIFELEKEALDWGAKFVVCYEECIPFDKVDTSKIKTERVGESKLFKEDAAKIYKIIGENEHMYRALIGIDEYREGFNPVLVNSVLEFCMRL